jgi:hypothetical protein
MPTIADALDFVRDPATGEEQLRRACRILELDDSGEVDDVRSRLLRQLEPMEVDSAIVCLNPRLTDSGADA